MTVPTPIRADAFDVELKIVASNGDVTRLVDISAAIRTWKDDEPVDDDSFESTDLGLSLAAGTDVDEDEDLEDDEADSDSDEDGDESEDEDEDDIGELELGLTLSEEVLMEYRMKVKSLPDDVDHVTYITVTYRNRAGLPMFAHQFKSNYIPVLQMEMSGSRTDPGEASLLLVLNATLTFPYHEYITFATPNDDKDYI